MLGLAHVTGQLLLLNPQSKKYANVITVMNNHDQPGSSPAAHTNKSHDSFSAQVGLYERHFLLSASSQKQFVH